MINRTYAVCTKKRLDSELYDKIFQSLFTGGIISDIIKIYNKLWENLIV